MGPLASLTMRRKAPAFAALVGVLWLVVRRCWKLRRSSTRGSTTTPSTTIGRAISSAVATVEPVVQGESVVAVPGFKVSHLWRPNDAFDMAVTAAVSVLVAVLLALFSPANARSLSFSVTMASAAFAALALLTVAAVRYAARAFYHPSEAEAIPDLSAPPVTNVAAEVPRAGEARPRQPSKEVCLGNDLARDAIKKAMRFVDGTDGGRWQDEGTETGMRLFSQDLGTRFGVFRGTASISGAELRQWTATGSEPPTAAEVFGISCSLMGKQLADPMKGDDILLQRFGPRAWLCYSVWKGSVLVAAQDGVFLQAVSKVQGPDGPRYTLVVVPATSELQRPHTAKVERLRAGQSFKRSALLMSAVDVQATREGGLKVSCVVHADPDVSFFVPSSMVTGALRLAPLRGLTFIHMALSLRLSRPLKIQAHEAEEEVVNIEIGGRTASVSRLLESVLA